MSKKDGVVYTPVDVVDQMLDMAGYFPDKMPNFLDMDFMDNSCGDGNILVVALERACDALQRMCDCLTFTPKQKYNYFRHGLTKHFHGIELSANECAKCMERMNRVVENFLCQPVNWKWDIRCGDALTMTDTCKYDFVVCNPPYIRVHDWESDLSGYEFVEQGMKDMYLAFYELGLRQVAKNGIMCYITPSSWFTSTAGRKLRKHLFDNRLIDKIYDYGHRQVFDNATTYVAITVINPMNARIGQEYVEYTSEELGRRFSIPYPAIELDGKFYFTDSKSFINLTEISLFHKGKIRVKNGYATLADDVFILEDIPWPESVKYVIPVLKSSNSKWYSCIFPYDEGGKTADEEELKASAPYEYKWLDFHRKKLEGRSTDEPWYAFGRTQAIKDTYKDKWAIKSIIKTIDDINPIKVPAGCGVYGGLYILCEGPEQLECLRTEEFLDYVKSLKKYKSGGYYTFSSKDLENYLNYQNYGKEERKNYGI